MLSSRSSRAFTLIELMVAISIGAILMTLAYVPYSFYTDKSRVSLSAQKLEQLYSKARLLSTTGYTFPGTTQNADLAVYVKKGSETAEMRVMKSGTTDWSLGTNSKIAEQLNLEDKVVISGLDASLDDLLVIYRAPVGTVEVRGPSGYVSASGGIVGMKGVTSGQLSRRFLIP